MKVFGWVIRWQWPILVFKPLPKTWRCLRCERWMRFDQTTAEGYCPHCGGRVRKTKKMKEIPRP